MKYMLLIYGVESAWNEQERADCMAESTQLSYELHNNGHYIGSSPLHPVSTATCVRIREGRRLITDGPFAETREQLGGYYIIDVENLDAAIEIAGRVPAADRGTVEIRPIFELPNLPPQAGTKKS